MSEECNHWWKTMGVITSAYFIDVDRSYMRWEISECKLCSEHKEELLDPTAEDGK